MSGVPGHNDRALLGLDGKRALVAGAGGLGAACARLLAEAGATVAVIDRDGGRAVALAEELSAAPGGAAELAGGLSFGVDLRDRRSARTAVGDARAALDGLDVCVHAVGINHRRPVLEITEAEWGETLSVNLSTAFHLGQAAGELMVAQGWGRITFISSVSGWLAHAHHAPYAASKGALNQLVRVMAREWAPAGVAVNAVAPGYVESALTRDYLNRNGHRAQLEALVPAGRLGSPEEVAGAVLFLSSSLAQFITGQVLFVDGGRTLV